MHKKSKKGGINKSKAGIVIIFIAIAIIILGILILKKPSITGLVISKETVHSDSLNLEVNESKSVVWNLRNPGNLKSIKADGSISRNGTAKVYIEKGNEKLLIFDSTKQLFDVNVEVLPGYKKIFQGDELLIQIVLFNLRGFGSADVNVKYSIKDPNGNLVAVEEENVTVETQSKFVRKLLIPSDLKLGTYVAFVEVKTPDGLIGTSSDLFEVAAKYKGIYPSQLKIYIAVLVIIFALFIAFILATYVFKRVKEKKETAELKRKTPLERIEKLEKELKALEAAHKSGFISKESYQKEKKRVEEKLGVSKK